MGTRNGSRTVVLINLLTKRDSEIRPSVRKEDKNLLGLIAATYEGKRFRAKRSLRASPLSMQIFPAVCLSLSLSLPKAIVALFKRVRSFLLATRKRSRWDERKPTIRIRFPRSPQRAHTQCHHPRRKERKKELERTRREILLDKRGRVSRNGGIARFTRLERKQIGWMRTDGFSFFSSSLSQRNCRGFKEIRRERKRAQNILGFDEKSPSATDLQLLLDQLRNLRDQA